MNIIVVHNAKGIAKENGRDQKCAKRAKVGKGILMGVVSVIIKKNRRGQEAWKNWAWQI